MTVLRALRRRLTRERLLDLAPALPVLAAIAVALLVIAAVGVNPFHALRVLVSGALGSTQALGVTAIKVTPLLITGLGVAIAIRAGMWNLGGQGQINAGALAATATAIYLVPRGPGPLIIALSIVAGFVGGAAWALVPALLRAFKGVSEIVTTLLLNFVADALVTLVVQGPMAQAGASYPQSPPIPTSAELPILVPNTQMHAGILIALGLAIVVGVVVWRTVFGFEVRAVGFGPKAARFSGIPVRRRLVETLLVSGGLAGIAGAIEILGVQWTLTPGFSPGYGFDAIAVALLGGAKTLGLILAAIFFGALRAGAPNLKLALNVPASLVYLIQGLAIVAVVAAYALRAYLRRRVVAPEAVGSEEALAPAIGGGVAG